MQNSIEFSSKETSRLAPDNETEIGEVSPIVLPIKQLLRPLNQVQFMAYLHFWQLE
jgi:hypothetical protein